MNKDVIYIEPEDDITDIITKIEGSKAKIVALVPPKKAGVLRSVVNIKLMAKSAKVAEKTIVLVTVDPSITKLAAASKLPVAKNLQSAPSVPTLETEENTTTKEEVNEPEQDNENEDAKTDDAAKTQDDENSDTEETKNEEAEDDEDEDEDDDDSSKKKKGDKSKKATGNKFINWIKAHKKITIFACIMGVALIVFLIWAFAVAPAVDISVAIKAESNNFSEGITFVNKLSDENAAEGKIYLEEKKIETVQEVNFEATGQKNKGERATGEVVVSAVFDASGAVAINPGTIFTINGLSYAANENKSLAWGGDEEECENEKKIVGGKIQCLISETVGVTATEGGSKYNIAASSTGWSTVANINVYSKSAMTGGTDSVVTVVQQSDIEKAKSQLATANESENKKKLYDSISDDSIIMESTFSQTTSAAVATPAADEEVKEGEKPVLKATTTTSVYILDKTKLEEFIRAKIKLSDDKKIFEIKDVYIDGFTETNNGYTGKLKALYFTGPKITENEVVEKIKGKGLGDAQREIRDIDGVSDVKINKSYPWVFAVPGDSNKIKVTFEIKDQDGQALEETEDKKDTKEDSGEENKSNEKEKK